MKEDFQGVWIPEKYIEKYGIVNALIVCAFLQNAPMDDYQKRKARKILGKKITNKKEIKEYIINNEGHFTCEWCNKKTHVLQKHHYPKSKKENGKEVVEICANCHVAFHNIEYLGIIKGV